MNYKTRQIIVKIIGNIILIGLIILIIYIISMFLNYMGKTTCENRWGNKGKYVGAIGGCLVKTKQGYIPEDKLYNLNNIENN